MEIKINGMEIVSTNPSNLDGVCRFDDFKFYARVNGHIIDDSEAEMSSEIEDTEKAILETFKDRVWIKFIQDFESGFPDKTYKKGEKRIAKIDIAELLEKAGIAIIDDDTYEKKKGMIS